MQDYDYYTGQKAFGRMRPLNDAIMYQANTAPVYTVSSCIPATIFFFILNTCNQTVNITYTVRYIPPCIEGEIS